MTSVDPITALLRQHDLRVTPQRRAILLAFRGTEDEHLSAEEVASRASASVPNIGRGTVYATLAELAELGVLASVGSADPIRYETNLLAHDHFRCRLCLRLFDVDLGGRELDRERLAGYRIEALEVHAEGVCGECRDYERGLRDGAAEVLQTATLPAEDLDALSCARVDSPLGELVLVASGEGIVHLAFADHADFELLLARARSRRGSTAARARLTAFAEALDGYFDGSREPLDEVVDWRLLTADQRRALLCVQRIPYSQPSSYDRLDIELDPYACGHLLGVNPLPLLFPCHRVSRGTERPDIYVGGVQRLHFLQTLEDGAAQRA
jgi:methylated-DNA-[protein]-cysteine S-methyltransferase